MSLLSDFPSVKTLGYFQRTHRRQIRPYISKSFQTEPLPCFAPSGRGHLLRLQFAPMQYETFCGGIFETNCYLIQAPDGPILFDAPDGACDWLVSKGITPKLLLLTHGHFDHAPDVSKIKRRFDCPVRCHAET